MSQDPRNCYKCRRQTWCARYHAFYRAVREFPWQRDADIGLLLDGVFNAVGTSCRDFETETATQPLPATPATMVI